MTAFRSLQSVLDFFGPGNIVLGIVLLVATPLVDRLLIRRKRITYRVLYNSKVGLGPERLHDIDEATGTNGAAEAKKRQLLEMTRLLERMSVVVIRIHNTGSYDIDADDFAEPLSFTFGQRTVWNARVSEASSVRIREQIRAGLQFFRTAAANGQGPADRGSLGTLRERLAQRFWRSAGVRTDPDLEPEQDWHGVRLADLSLPHRQKFKLVVVLHEPGAGEISKDIEASGKLKETGLIKDDKQRRRITLPRVTGTLAVALTLFLVLSLVFVPQPPDGETSRCAAGTLAIEGSSVFMPTMADIAADYTKACRKARVSTRPTGSIEGVRAVEAGNDTGFGAVSDGKQMPGSGSLHAEQIAIVVYHVVVNTSAGVNAVTTAQLRGIYAGTYTDWSQLRGGAPLPIRIVGRGQESGTRELFERSVLGTGESGLSSNECLRKDRNPSAPTIRCERDSNTEVVRKISETPGAIGYADAPALSEARKDNSLIALALDGRIFDAAAGVESGYPFWTVEYFYTKSEPAAGTLAAMMIAYLQKDKAARLRLKDAGYLPCTTPDGAPLALCNYR